MTEEQRKAVWPTTINGQSLSGSTGTMETQLPSIQVSIQRPKCNRIQDPLFDIALKSNKSENTAKIGLIKINEC
jgi:hypothetical protein